MNPLMPFIVLIERRLRPMLMLLIATLLAAFGLVAHAAGGHGQKHRKIARDLQASVDAVKDPAERWVRRRKGQREVDALVVSNSTDPELRDLRAAVERLGGTVNARFSSINALSITLPARRLAQLDARDDVVSVSPNRPTRRSASALDTTTGTLTSAVRTYSSSDVYTGLDGSGVGIAVLDSGVMAAHHHFRNASGASRVAMNLNFVTYSGSSFLGMTARRATTRRRRWTTPPRPSPTPTATAPTSPRWPPAAASPAR